MKQSTLMKTKRSIKAILMMLQLLVMLLTMSLSMSSHAQTGNLTITRTPSTMIAGQPFTIVWSSTEPTAVATKYSCVSPAGGFAGSATLSVSGSANGTADPNWVWKDSTCEWTVVNAAGSVLASRTDIMKTVPASVSGVTYIHTDGLGSPVAKSDAAGNLVANSRTRYEPYGMAVAGTATPTIGFTGHVNDADTGLTYMQQRYYDPVAGRFLSTDPVLTDENTAASFNRYVYANNSPYKYVDPDGRFAFVGALIGGGIEAGVQIAMNGRVTNWKSVGVAAGVGFFTGGLGGAMGKAAVSGALSARTAITVTAAGSAGAVGTGKIVDGAINGKLPTAGEVLTATAIGGVGGGAGAKVGLAGVGALEKLAKLPGVAGQIGTTTQNAIQQGGQVVGPATTIGQNVTQRAIDTTAVYAEKKINP